MPGPQPTPTEEPHERGAAAPPPGPGWTPGSAFDFSGAGADPGPPGPAPWSASYVSPSSPAPFQEEGLVPRQTSVPVPTGPAPMSPVPDRRAAPRRPTGRLPWVSLVLVVLVSAVIALSTYQTLASIDITSMDPVGAALDWSLVVGVALLATPFLFVLAVVALVRSRGLVAVVGLVAAMVLPLGCLVVGGQAGVSAFTAHVTEETEGVRDVALETAQEGLAGLGPAAGPLGEWLLENFADADQG